MSRRAELVWFTDIKRESVEWLFPGRIPLGMLSLLIGDAGLGKTLFACHVAAQLSRGELGAFGPSATLFLTAEDSLTVTLRPRLDAAGAVRERVATYRLRVGDDADDGLMIPDDLALLEQLIGESKARHVVIDPLGGHLPGSINAWQDQSVRRALAPLARIAETHACAIVAVMHLNKKDSTDALRRINGSTGFGAAARSVLLFARDPDDPDGATGRRRVLAHEKCNVGETAPGLVYEVEPIHLPPLGEQPDVQTARLRLIGESSRRAGDLLAIADTEQRTDRDEAKDLLRQELELGPRLWTDLARAGRAAGLSERTLVRARSEMKSAGEVTNKKLGFSGGWEWALTQTNLFHEGGHDAGGNDGDGDVGHLRRIPLQQRDSDPLGADLKTEGGHILEMATFAEREAQELVDRGLAMWVPEEPAA